MTIPRQVYAIQHNVTGKIYVGSSAKPEHRYKTHIYSLRSGKHNIREMQEDFINYGEDYSFYILETIERFEDRGKEYEWMKKLGSCDKNKGYNYKDAGVKGMVIPLKAGVPKPNN